MSKQQEGDGISLEQQVKHMERHVEIEARVGSVCLTPGYAPAILASLKELALTRACSAGSPRQQAAVELAEASVRLDDAQDSGGGSDLCAEVDAKLAAYRLARDQEKRHA